MSDETKATDRMKCPDCHGTGEITDRPDAIACEPPARHKCERCDGIGYISLRNVKQEGD